jgi:hypothetical protein
MIARIWRGWTTPVNADAYETFVVPPEARALLARFDAHSSHYEIVERQTA